MSDTLKKYRLKLMTTPTVKAIKRLQEWADRGAYVLNVELELELSVLDWIEQQGYVYMTSQGVPSLEQQYLLGYMKRLWVIALKYEGLTYISGRDLLTGEYVFRGHPLLGDPVFSAALWALIDQAKTYKQTHESPDMGFLSKISAYKLTGDQLLVNGATADVVFDTALFDGLGEYDATAHTFTATDAGYYLVCLRAFTRSYGIPNGAGIYGWVFLTQNGYTKALDLFSDSMTLYGSEIPVMQTEISVILKLDAGDVLKPMVYFLGIYTTWIVAGLESSSLQVHRLS